MAQNNIIPQQKINEAANGNQSLRELLQAVVKTTTVATTVSSTGSGKPVPQQASASVSYLNKTYIVQIQNPGATNPVSALQAAQAAQSATLSSNLAPVTAVFHQIRAATSPSFSLSANVQVFGGDTGSTQTYWELSGLGSGRFYFQVRSSYDGANWNLWRNANGGQTITKGVNGITTETVTNAVWAAFTLPGDELCAFGAGFVPDQGTFGVANNLYTSAMLAIAGPNGFTQTGNLSHGIRKNAATINTPANPGALSGPADYATLVAEQYEDGEGHVWSGSANIFGFAYDPLGANVTEYTTAQGRWVTHVLPGGAMLAVGAGTVPSGSAIVPPSALSWVTADRILGIVTPQNAYSGTHQAHGIAYAGFTGMTVSAVFQDGEGNQWSGTANWFAVAFSPGIAFQAVTGGRFVVFDLPDGTKVALGQGTIASGTSFTLPAGFAPEKTLSIGVPVGWNDTGHAMSGIAQCSIEGLLALLSYQDGAANYWGGQVSYMCFAWIP